MPYTKRGRAEKAAILAAFLATGKPFKKELEVVPPCHICGKELTQYRRTTDDDGNEVVQCLNYCEPKE